MRNKRKGILMASAILGSAAIVSTGFAAWVITTPTSAAVEGNITVDTVTDNRLVMSATWATGDGTVKFGAPAKASQTIQNHWLTSDGAVVEDLDHTLNVTIDWKADSRKTEDERKKIDGTISAAIQIGTGTGDSFVADQAFTSNYIKLPDIADVTVTDGGATTVAVNFEWGTAFGATSTNPYTYFNGKTDPNAFVSGNSGNTWADQAIEDLTAVHNLNSKTFKITLTFTLTNPTA